MWRSRNSSRIIARAALAAAAWGLPVAGIGQGAWSGTISFDQTASGVYTPPPTIISSSTTDTSVASKATLTIGGGTAFAKISYELKEFTTLKDDYDSRVVNGTVRTLTTASQGGVPTRFKVEIREDGSYEIEFSADGVTGLWTKEETSRTTCKTNVDPECRNSNARNTDSGPVAKLGFVSQAIRGTINQAAPNKLSGSTSTPYEYGDGILGVTRISWTLAR